jgi:hypothetical protein
MRDSGLVGEGKKKGEKKIEEEGQKQQKERK